MVFSRAAIVLIVGTAVVSIAACNSDRAYAPPDTILTDHQVSMDIASSAGSDIAADLETLDGSAVLSGGNFSMEGPGPSARGDLRADTGPATSSCSYSSGRWNCAPVVEKGITTVRSYAYFDAAGKAMQYLDNLKTASINYQFTRNGTVTQDTTFSGVVHSSRNITVSGLLGVETTRRWDGFGASADTNTHHDSRSTRHYAGKSVDSVKAVVYPQPRTPGSYPLSGSMIQVINYTVTSTGKGIETRSVDRRVVTTYDGSALAKIQSGTVTCVLHLDTHKVDSCSG